MPQLCSNRLRKFSAQLGKFWLELLTKSYDSIWYSRMVIKDKLFVFKSCFLFVYFLRPGYNGGVRVSLSISLLLYQYLHLRNLNLSRVDNFKTCLHVWCTLIICKFWKANEWRKGLKGLLCLQNGAKLFTKAMLYFFHKSPYNSDINFGSI